MAGYKIDNEELATDDLKLMRHSAPAGYWGWEPSGKPIAIQIKLDAVDGMLTSIIDGFGSIPKRGAEVGGLLLGTMNPESSLKDSSLKNPSSTVYKIEDFADVPCSHKFGPSYVLSSDDHIQLQAAIERVSSDGRGLNVLGFYRSHTREGLFLSPEDHELLRNSFAGPDQIVLLVRPSAMKVSQAGFFYRENGSFQAATDKEFPFRRSELETGEAPVRRPLHERMRGEPGRRTGPPMPDGRDPAMPSPVSKVVLSSPRPFSPVVNSSLLKSVGMALWGPP